MLYHTRWVILFLLTLFVGLEDLQAENSSDEIFGGQILTMTVDKPPLAPSNDPRFKDNNDGTVTDLQEGLMWKKIYLYQEKKYGLAVKNLRNLSKALISKRMQVIRTGDCRHVRS